MSGFTAWCIDVPSTGLNINNYGMRNKLITSVRKKVERE